MGLFLHESSQGTCQNFLVNSSFLGSAWVTSSRSGKVEQLGIAVSGGVDSMALCTLLRQHIDLEGWPESSLAYTIDHRVRPESAEEAVKVAQWVEKLGTP